MRPVNSDIQTDNSQQRAEERLRRLEREEGSLSRISLFFVVLLGTALAATQWEWLTALPRHIADVPGIGAMPTGTLVLALLFAIYVGLKRHEAAELRGVVRGMREREKSPPSEEQLSKLLEVISHSQRGYRELIDSLDTAVLGMSLQGT